MRLPLRVKLLHWTVKVKQVADVYMRDECGDNVDGCWVQEDMTIYIRKRLPARRKCYLLAHEVTHMAADLAHSITDNGVPRGEKP